MVFLTDTTLGQSNMTYFKQLHINPVKANLSFMSAIQNEDSNQNDLRRLLWFFGALTDIDEAPLRFNALILKNPFGTASEIQSIIMKHYQAAVLAQSYKVCDPCFCVFET